MDRAQAREEEMRRDALAEHDRRAHGRPVVFGHPLRLRRGDPRDPPPGVQTCIECQHDNEKRPVREWGVMQ